jgi:hypothetical protein
MLRRSIDVCQKAMKKFFSLHRLSPTIVDIDHTGVYFCLPEKVTLKADWYREFNDKRSSP